MSFSVFQWSLYVLAGLLCTHYVIDAEAGCTGHKKEFEEFASGLAELSFDLLKNRLEASKGDNVVISPYSLSVAFAMAVQGAGGQTAKQIETALHFPKPNKHLLLAFHHLNAEKKRLPDDKVLSTANAGFLAKQLVIEPEFKSTLNNVFQSEFQSVDFGQKDTTSELINKWAAEATHDKIKKIISTEEIDRGTAFVLLNAVYFKGDWTQAFKESRTRREAFHGVGPADQQADLMRQTAKFNYLESTELEAKIIELGYQGGQYSLVAILPNEHSDPSSGLQPLLDRLTGRQFLKSIGELKINRTVDVTLPKFNINNEIDFIPALKQLGIRDAFDNTANFTGLTPHPVSITGVKQVATIEVNEKGTVAAAVTAIRGMLRSSRVGLQFRANRPFVYALIRKTAPHPLVIFTGLFQRSS